MHKHGLYHHAVSIGLSVTFVDFVKTSSHNILVFPYQMSWQYSNRNPPNGGVECRWGRQKSRVWANIWLHRVLWTVPAAIAVHLAAMDHGKLMTLVTGKRQSFLMTGDDDDEVYDKKPQRYAEDSVT